MTKLGIAQVDLLDATQTVMLEAYKSFPTYDPLRARPERWLNRIAVHVAQHHLDRAYRRHEVLDDLASADVVCERPTAIDALLSEEGRAFLTELVLAMPPALSAMLLDHDIHGIPMADIAARRGVPLSTAYKWHARALLAARKVARERVARGKTPYL